MVRFLRNIGMDVSKRKYSQAFTTIEMLIGMTIMIFFFSTTISMGLKIADGIRSKTVIDDLIAIQSDIESYRITNNYPDTLDDIYPTPQLDPWGTPYQYLRISGGGPNVTGMQRKYQSLKVNTDYDLYSMGPDGETASPLTAAISRDDILRGRNSRFIGYVTDFQ